MFAYLKHQMRKYAFREVILGLAGCEDGELAKAHNNNEYCKICQKAPWFDKEKCATCDPSKTVKKIEKYKIRDARQRSGNILKN